MYKVTTKINGEVIELRLETNSGELLNSETLPIEAVPTDESAYVAYLQSYGARTYQKYESDKAEQKARQTALQERIDTLSEFPTEVALNVNS